MMSTTYPIDKHIRRHYYVALALAFWIFIFLFFAEPFKIDRFTTAKKLWTLPIYGLIQGICYSIPLWYQNKIVQQEKQWNLKNELVFLVFVSLLAIIFNYCFYRFFVTAHVNTYSFVDQVRIQVLPALAFVLPILICTRYVLGKFSEMKKKDTKIIIKGRSTKDILKLHVNELLYIKSSDNYVEVNFLESQLPVKKVIRAKLSEIEKNYPELLKTHRSYLINPTYFKRFENEKNKFSVILQGGVKVPISRGKFQEVKVKLAS